MAEEQLVLDSNEFWSDPLRKARELQDRLLGKNREALFVTAPEQVMVGARDTAPVIIVRTATIANAAGSPFARTAILTVADLDNHYVYAGMAIPPTSRSTGKRAGAPRQPPQDGMAGEVFALDARSALDLPWKPARLLVTLILRDTVTARLPVNLMEPEVGYKDPEVAKFREQERRRPNVPAAWPPPRLRIVDYDPLPGMPPVPAEPGIAMTAPRLMPMDEARPCKLTGSFRLPILPKYVVPGGKAPGAEKLLEQYQGQDHLPTGIVPITLVATGSKSPTPFVWRLLVPTFDPVDPADPGLVTGHFSINLETLGNVREIEQTLFIYAFAGQILTGPVPVAFLER